ncbi:MAG: LysR family transcriptional regulator [Steroidobacteraceae bacterium]
MRKLDDMYLFAKVVSAGSFSGAARELGLQTSLLSRRVAALEKELGVRLLNRSTRRIAPTETGRGFYRHCQALVTEADAAWDSVEQTRSAPRGLVRLSCPVQMLRMPVAGVLTTLMVQYPEVRVQVEATNRRVNVIEEGFDIALRVRTPPLLDSDLVVRQLGSAEVILVGAPALFARQPLPRSITDLAGLPTLSQVYAGERYSWELTGPHGEPVVHRHVPRLMVDDFPLLLQAALDGLGIALLPEMIVREELAAGRLVPVLPDHRLPQGIAHAVFPSRRGMVPAVRVVLDALAAGFTLG